MRFSLVAEAHGQPNGHIQSSLVRITSTEVEPDYRAPWNSGSIGRGVGAGFVIDGQRILTNAHVVSNSRYLTVEREGDPNKYPATVQFVAHDCDLALLQVANANFWKNMKPLSFGGIPALESTVSAYGYPIGGERMSVTTGIVSRIDFNLYTHSAIDSHLAIQISAQINPGNSGGPVMQSGKVVGVAFQGYSGDIAQGVAYMIPTPVIRRFLKDIEDGHYDRYVDLGITYTKLQNPAQRHFLGLKDDDRGVLVGTVIDAGPCGKLLQKGDVLLSIDGHPIASDAFVEYEGERVQMPEVVERKFKGDTVKLDLLRNKQPMSVDVTLGYGLAILHAGPQLRYSAALRGLRRPALPADVARSPRGLPHQRSAGAAFLRFLRERTDLSATSRGHHSDEHPARPDQHLSDAISLQHRGRNQRAENRHAAGSGPRL